MDDELEKLRARAELAEHEVSRLRYCLKQQVATTRQHLRGLDSTRQRLSVEKKRYAQLLQKTEELYEAADQYQKIADQAVSHFIEPLEDENDRVTLPPLDEYAGCLTRLDNALLDFQRKAS